MNFEHDISISCLSCLQYDRMALLKAVTTSLSRYHMIPLLTLLREKTFSLKLRTVVPAVGVWRCAHSVTTTNSSKQTRFSTDTINILNETYVVDSCTNVTPRVTAKIGRLLHNRSGNPVNLVRQRIQNHFYTLFTNRAGNPIFAVFDNVSPVVTPAQNFDSLLVPPDHPSRSPSDTYYVNSRYLLRSHTSAHDEELIRMGFNTFLIVGDVYRRDDIDASHYPAFHQMEGVRLFTEQEVP